MYFCAPRASTAAKRTRQRTHTHTHTHTHDSAFANALSKRFASAARTERAARATRLRLHERPGAAPPTTARRHSSSDESATRPSRRAERDAPHVVHAQKQNRARTRVFALKRRAPQERKRVRAQRTAHQARTATITHKRKAAPLKVALAEAVSRIELRPFLRAQATRALRAAAAVAAVPPHRHRAPRANVPSVICWRMLSTDVRIASSRSAVAVCSRRSSIASSKRSKIKAPEQCKEDNKFKYVIECYETETEYTKQT